MHVNGRGFFELGPENGYIFRVVYCSGRRQEEFQSVGMRPSEVLLSLFNPRLIVGFLFFVAYFPFLLEAVS